MLRSGISRLGRRGLAATLTVIAVLLTGAPAFASSIVFVRDGDVWLARPDGGGQHRVTNDGTATAPYRSPTQADDGTIVVARGTHLHRLRQSGEALNPPFSVQTLISPSPVDVLVPAVSPNGATVAYSYLATCGLSLCFESNYTAAGSFTSVLDNRLASVTHMSWMGNATTVSTQAAAVYTDQPNGVGIRPAFWFSDPDLEISSELSAAEVSTAGDRIALVRTGSDGRSLRLFTATGPPPATPVQRCVVPLPGADDPTWSPDGAALAVAGSAGVFVLSVGDIAAGVCPAAPAAPLLPGASTPDWGPADVNPPPPTDGDGDGVPDASDACPTAPGPAASGGCPARPPADQDGDGVPDASDRCPTTSGPAVNVGCPVPAAADQDRDGVPDGTDRCPTRAGSAARGGCPPAPVGVARRGDARANMLTGSAGPDRLFGLGGGDLLRGLAGADLLVGGTGGDRLLGGAGNDRLLGGPGPDVLAAGPGPDVLLGGPGADRLAGDAGPDRFAAGPGDDVVDSRDGRAETVDCGPGRDRALADARDRLLGCERRGAA